MTYLENCIKYRDQIAAAFEPARLETGFFTPAEIEQLMVLQFRMANRVKWTSTSNNIQPVCNIDDLFEIIPGFTAKFESIIGKFADNHTGNYYITTQLHDAHVDLITQSESERDEFAWTNSVIPYKSVVIPLMITEGADAHTAFFDQRHIGHSITFDRVNASSQENSDYEIARNYPDFYDINGNVVSSSEDYIRNTGFLMPQIPVGNLRGLSVETVLPYSVGDIMVFDACQIHASCVKRSKPNYRWLKSGMNIQFYKEIKEI
jgi:hypothetical protein